MGSLQSCCSELKGMKNELLFESDDLFESVKGPTKDTSASDQAPWQLPVAVMLTGEQWKSELGNH